MAEANNDQKDFENSNVDVSLVTPSADSQENVNSTPTDLSSFQEGTVVAKSKKAGKKSEIWDQYKQETVDGKLKARCKHCDKLLLGDPSQGTSHLRKHIDRCPRRKIKDIRQQVLQSNANKGKTELSTYNFDQESSRDKLAKIVIMHEYPLKMVEHEGFSEFIKSLNPCFNLVSRNTLKNDCFKLYNGLKEVVMHNFESCESRIAITTDMWTSSHQKKGFMVVITTDMWTSSQQTCGLEV